MANIRRRPMFHEWQPSTGAPIAPLGLTRIPTPAAGNNRSTSKTAQYVVARIDCLRLFAPKTKALTCKHSRISRDSLCDQRGLN
jgi:hypothetical protein